MPKSRMPKSRMPKSKRAKRKVENPEWSTADFAQSTKLQGASLTQAAKAARRGRGPQVAPTKVAISIRLNPRIIAHFKAGGAGWQSRMEKVLQKASSVKA
jgi:uncharacterized protein (DUF4415 family)